MQKSLSAQQIPGVSGKRHRETMQKLFGDEVIGNIRKQLSEKGLDGLDTKQLLVFIAAYFNNELAKITGEITSMRGEITSMSNKIGKVGWALVGAVIAVATGIIANLIVALLTK